MFDALRDAWKNDPILHWQDVVIREYVNLQKVDDTSFPDMVPFSYEFRLFFWKNKLVTYGAYWTMGTQYDIEESEKDVAFSLAQIVAERIDVPFLAVDIAKTQSGKWIVIEVNDAQESGYVGVDRKKLWRNIIEIENDAKCMTGE